MHTISDMKAKLEALQSKASVRILALESSCDETAAAIVENGRTVLSSVIFSQVDTHALYGGVVPEIASRAHVDACDRVIDQALKEAGMVMQDVDAVAVTYGPGLVGALLTGVSCMKGLSYTARLPLIPVNHIEGHVSANYITTPDLLPPFICLVVSGGHSHLVRVNDYADYTLLGQTMDDAAGEAFDKAARVLGLPYPGGPHLSKLAEGGDDTYLKLPRPAPEGQYDYSFSGLKTAFLNACHKMEQKGEALPKADLAASFERAVVDSLCEKAMLALRDSGLDTLCLAGGVSANRRLRAQMQALAAGETLWQGKREPAAPKGAGERGTLQAGEDAGSGPEAPSGSEMPSPKRGGNVPFRLCMPELWLCTDNAAMIGSAAYYRMQKGDLADLSLNAVPALKLV